MKNKKQTAREWARKHYVSYPCYIQGSNDGEVKAFSLEDFLDEYDRRKEAEQKGRSLLKIPFEVGDYVFYVNRWSIARYTFRHANIIDNKIFIRVTENYHTYDLNRCFKNPKDAAAHYEREYLNEGED